MKDKSKVIQVGINQAELQLLRQGQKIAAIKSLRERYRNWRNPSSPDGIGLGLADAKNLVERGTMEILSTLSADQKEWFEKIFHDCVLQLSNDLSLTPEGVSDRAYEIAKAALAKLQEFEAEVRGIDEMQNESF